jgi:hypothetical protein
VTATDIAAQVEVKLAGLGDSPDAIADRLRALGIKGRRANESCCAIANLIKSVDGVTCVVVKNANAWLFPDSRIQLRGPVAEFIERFDRGVYLDLVEVGV